MIWMIQFGFIDSIIRAVIRAIVSPIADALSWLFQTIFGPILQEVLPIAIKFFMDLLMSLLAKFFFIIFQQLLKVVDILEKAFKVFAGVEEVTYRSSNMYILDILFKQPKISTAFYYITFISLVVCFIFTIYAVARSALDFDFDNKRPVGRVLNSFMKSALLFLLVPVFTLFALKLTSIVMLKTYEATASSDAGLSTTIFLVASINAAQNDANNGQNANFSAYPRNAYYSNPPTKSWKDTDQVERDFKFGKFDYIVGYGSTLFLIYVLIMCCFVFIQRIFELILLYVTSPLFVAAMPLDDGEAFKKWRDMFFAKLITGLGMVITMNVYLMFVPVVMRDINFSIGGGPVVAYLVKLLFLLGGALAVKQSQSLLTSIVNQQAGMMEASNASSGGFLAVAGYNTAVGVTKTIGSAAIAVGTAAVNAAGAAAGVPGIGTPGGAIAEKANAAFSEKAKIDGGSFGGSYTSGAGSSSGASKAEDAEQGSSRGSVRTSYQEGNEGNSSNA